MKFFLNKQNVFHLVVLAFFAVATLNISACSSSPGGYTANGAASSPATNAAWNSVPMQGIVTGGPWGNSLIYSLSQAAETITVQIPLPTAPPSASTSLPVSEIPGATVTITQDSTGQWYFQLTLPLQLLVKGIAYQNPGILPNGQPLPAIPNGELPTITAHVTANGSSMSFYVYGSAKYFAVFLPTPSFNAYVALQYPVMNSSNSEILGYFNTIPNTTATSTNAGLYVALVFPAELQTLLNTLF